MNHFSTLMKKNTTNNLLKLFSSCILSKGILRAIIFDTQRGLIDTIPIDLYNILINNQGVIDLLKLRNNKSNSDLETIDEYIEFLLSRDYIFKVSRYEIKRFPPLSLEWSCPSLISNCILELNPDIDYRLVVNEIINIGCKYVELRFSENYEANKISSILDLFINSIVVGIEVVLPYNIISKESLLRLSDRISFVIFFNSPFNEINENIIFTKDIITNNSCGKIGMRYFNSSLDNFTESQKHNTCLNRKISIDFDGNIKNCPSMSKSYGNIKDTTLAEALNADGFKDLWYIHKDQIEVCKDCEFRHICTDCRAFIQDPDNIYSKPAKCSYDPYTATWGDENPTNNVLYGK